MIDEVAYLISKVSKGKDTNGYDITEEKRTEVFVQESGTSRSEFYQAARAGMQISKTFRMSRWDYNGETELEHDGKHYKVERSYPLNVDEIELNCSEVQV